MEIVTYHFPNESNTREAAKIIYRNINDNLGGRYSATVIVSNNHLQQRYGVYDSQDEEVMYFMVNAKNNPPYITFNYKSEVHRAVIEETIAKAAEEQEGVEQKSRVKA